MRTLVDIPEDHVRRLDALAVKAKRSRAAEIREAVDRHLRAATDNSWILGEGYGYWKDRDDIGDGVQYQREMRKDRDED